MQGYTITVRMEDGEEPQVTVTAREEYRHAERGELATASTTVEGELPADLVDAVRDALQAILDDRREAAADAGYDGAILAASASIRRAQTAVRAAARAEQG